MGAEKVMKKGRRKLCKSVSSIGECEPAHVQRREREESKKEKTLDQSRIRRLF